MPADRDDMNLSASERTEFDEFESEYPSPASQDLPVGASRPVLAPHTTVSLAELASSGVVLDSYEAIAVVEGLCSSFIDSGDRVGPASLDSSGVFVHAVGTVSAASDGRRDALAAVQAVGRILSETLPDNDFLFLRERIVSRATVSPPYYSSLEDFLHALDYYARPNRAELVQAVYLRWCETLIKPPVQPAITELALAAAPPPETRPRVEWPIRGARGAIWIAGVVVTAGAIWIAARQGWFVRGRPATPSVTSSPAAIAPAAAAAAPPPGAAPRVTTAPSHSSQKTIAPRAARPAGLARDPGAKAPIESAAPAQKNAATTLVPDEEVVIPVSLATEFPASVDRAYDATNTDVVPPRVTYPQVLDLLPVGFQRDDVTAIEIIVNETGSVVNARAVRAPNTIGEYAALVNGLSIAKTWRFRPATLAGRPVKYRLLISLSAK